MQIRPSRRDPSLPDPAGADPSPDPAQRRIRGRIRPSRQDPSLPDPAGADPCPDLAQRRIRGRIRQSRSPPARIRPRERFAGENPAKREIRAEWFREKNQERGRERNLYEKKGTARTRGRGCGRRRRAPAPALAAHAGLRSLSPSPRALVLDFFCMNALDVAAELALPAYFLFTSSASALAVFLHLPVLHARSAKCFRELGAEPLRVPGVPPLPADHMPLPILDRADEAYEGFLGHSRRLARCAGIVVNTSRSLEPRAVDALIAAGLCVPDHERPRPTPPVYCVGPLVKSSDRTRGRGEECLAWLNSQPKASIVFLCFGSVGRFSAAQLKELTKGIEKSGHRFLWVVRSPPSDDNDDPEKRFLPPPEPDLEKLLPEGFPYRTRERGMVVQSWAPQREVLAHESVGGLGYDIAPLRAAVPAPRRAAGELRGGPRPAALGGAPPATPLRGPRGDGVGDPITAGEERPEAVDAFQKPKVERVEN
ncbi:anthocyanidin 5,3-O-glucosyltransferase-like [Ananas comosus]|uniref:Anthocyanidin 5,3-O-glucosyltransferase-like n=1 Tax=Ananas comosus TaxID=4615 RepID=A0A6P5FNB3_ANACO|nr:anthocyanidin 5,3-O-glucosyltransferase-like [Ananas comosus]